MDWFLYDGKKRVNPADALYYIDALSKCYFFNTCRNQEINFQCKFTAWFLNDGNNSHSNNDLKKVWAVQYL